MATTLERRLEITPHDEERIVLALRIYYSRFETRCMTSLKGAIVKSLCHYDKFIDTAEVGRLYERIHDYRDILRSKGIRIGIPDDREEARIYLTKLNDYLSK